MHDQYHNKIYDKVSNGYESKREYDLNNNIIHYINNEGFEQWWEYDDNHLIHFINTAGLEEWHEYDENNKTVHNKHSGGYERWAKYSEDGELIHQKEINYRK